MRRTSSASRTLPQQMETLNRLAAAAGELPDSSLPDSSLPDASLKIMPLEAAVLEAA